jgi:hypothetical protein
VYTHIICISHNNVSIYFCTDLGIFSFPVHIYSIGSVVDPNPKESVSFGRIRIRIKKKSLDSNKDSDPDTVVKKFLGEKLQIKHFIEKKKGRFFYWKT